MGWLSTASVRNLGNNAYRSVQKHPAHWNAASLALAGLGYAALRIYTMRSKHRVSLQKYPVQLLEKVMLFSLTPLIPINLIAILRKKEERAEIQDDPSSHDLLKLDFNIKAPEYNEQKIDRLRSENASEEDISNENERIKTLAKKISGQMSAKLDRLDAELKSKLGKGLSAAEMATKLKELNELSFNHRCVLQLNCFGDNPKDPAGFGFKDEPSE